MSPTIAKAGAVSATILAVLLHAPTPARAATPHPSHTNGGCAGRVTDYVINNHRNGAIALKAMYMWPDLTDPDPATAGRVATQALTVSPYYFRCTTRGDGHGHIIPGPVVVKMYKINWCWHFITNEEHWWFQGWKAAGRAYDADGTNVRPGTAEIPDSNGRVLSCHMQYVQDRDRRWQRMENLPLFRANATMVIRNPLPDHNALLGAQRFNPREDWRVRSAHW